MVEEGLWTASRNGRKRMALLDVSGSKTLDARVFKVREELQERYPEHAIDIRLCKYSKLGELIGKLSKVLFSSRQRTTSSWRCPERKRNNDGR